MHTEAILTPEYIKNMLKQHHRLYFSTANLNEKLYLHYKGFNEIQNLEEFKNLKVLFFEGNGCKYISGLS